MCATGGIGVAIGNRGWADIVTITGSALGVLALALVAAILLGGQLPLIAGDRQAFIALAALGAVKVLIATGDHLRK